MSEHDGEPIESVNDDEANVLLADPDDYHQSQRLREIHSARRKVHEVFTSMDTYTADTEHNNQRGRLAHAVTAYVVELLPIFRQTEVSTALPPKLEWDTLGEYVTTTGYDRTADEYAGYQASMFVFEQANQRFAEVKPLVEPDETDEWEITT